MQQKNTKLVKNILTNLADHRNLKGIQGLAADLGVRPSKLYGWIRNGKIADPGLILTKYPYINPKWLIEGEQPMMTIDEHNAHLLSQSNFVDNINDHVQPETREEKSKESSQESNFSMTDMLAMTKTILKSRTVYKPALAANIRAFYKAVEMEEEMNDIRGEMKNMTEEMRQIKDLLLQLGGTLPEKKPTGTDH